MTEQSPISLSTLIRPDRTVSFDFPDYNGMVVELCYLSREARNTLRKKCVTNSFDRASGQMVEKLNEDVFVKAYCKAVVKGWKGLKYKYLEELLLVDTGDLDPEDELPFTLENAELLLRGSEVFDTWTTATVDKLENFTSAK